MSFEGPLRSADPASGASPGFGSRSARRAVLHLMKNSDSLMLPLAEEMMNVAHQVRTVQNAVISTLKASAGFAGLQSVMPRAFVLLKMLRIFGLWNVRGFYRTLSCPWRRDERN